MHSKNRYRGDHDFPALARVVPELARHFITTPDGRLSLDFTNSEAVLLLNRALLMRDYGLKFWDLPAGFLCPGVPGRLDYIHAIADLLVETARPPVPGSAKGKGPGSQQSSKGQPQITGLDVGTGASLIYPILGGGEYGWRFVATDVDDRSLKIAGAIATFNPVLKGKVTLRKQPRMAHIFQGVIQPGEHFAFTMCNPPFFTDEDGARAAAAKKWTKLGENTDTGHNFGGRPNELWTPGAKPAFLRRMIIESADYAKQIGWFTTLVSKKGYLHAAKQLLDRAGVKQRKVIQIGQGGKIRRVLAWGF